MTRVLFILLSFSLFAFGAVKNLKGIYNIEYGIFGKLGIAEASIDVKENGSYEIKAKAYATGIAKALSGDLVEEYLSKGIVEEDRYKPRYFKKITNKKHYHKIEEYFFDYKNKIITKKYHRKKGRRIYDLQNLSNIKYKYTKVNKEEKLKFWSDEDILSLFFNVRNYMDIKEKGNLKIVSAVGASTKREGKIDILVPKDEKYKKLKKFIKDDGDILIVKIYKKIFASKDGEFFLSIGKDGLCNKAILKDVMFFGDITATLKKR